MQRKDVENSFYYVEKSGNETGMACFGKKKRWNYLCRGKGEKLHRM